jgi:Tfp pilus assembly protein PilW
MLGFNSLRSEKGYTVVELLVSGSLGVLLLALVVGSSVATRNNYKKDLVRARSNESLRGVIDIIAGDARLAGENLGAGFPAVEVVDSGINDSLIIRRNLLSEVLPLCANI